MLSLFVKQERVHSSSMPSHVCMCFMFVADREGEAELSTVQERVLLSCEIRVVGVERVDCGYVKIRCCAQKI